jgi:hypothetical protein
MKYSFSSSFIFLHYFHNLSRMLHFSFSSLNLLIIHPSISSIHIFGTIFGRFRKYLKTFRYPLSIILIYLLLAHYIIPANNLKLGTTINLNKFSNNFALAPFLNIYNLADIDLAFLITYYTCSSTLSLSFHIIPKYLYFETTSYPRTFLST